MSNRTIRLGSAISFNEEKEADIISKITELSKRHKLGEFISYLLKIALESPDKMENIESLRRAIVEIDEYGMSYDRYKFFNDVNNQVKEMKAKVDAMYEMNLKLLTLAKFGKHLGIEQRTNNSLMAQFVLEKEINQICNKLGLDNPKHMFESNKIQETDKKAEDIMSYIIETYDNIINEIKGSILSNVAIPAVTINNKEGLKGCSLQDNTAQTAKVDNIVQLGQTVQAVKEEKEEIKYNEEGLDEPIDFDHADFGALNSFFGNSN